MRKLLIAGIIIILFMQEVQAQESIEANAQGENTYLRFTDEVYDPAKHYTLIIFSPKQKKHDAIAGLTQMTNVTVYEWKAQRDLSKILDAHHITVSAQIDRTFRLDGPDYTVNTTSEYAITR